MSRRRKSKSRSTSKPRITHRFQALLARVKPTDWHIIKRSGVGVAWIACVAAVALAWSLGVPQLQAFASRQVTVNPHHVTVRFVDPPQWIKGPLADNLLRTAAMQVGGDPLVRDDLVAIRQALIDTGWFDSINQVERTEPDLIEIDAQFVRPYTLIHDGEGHHLIDGDGKLLPKSYGPDDKLPVMLDPRSGQSVPMIAISGVHFDRPTIGRRWDGADVTSGLKLMQLLDRQPWRHQITEIDVAAFLSDGPIRLITDKGSVILWGGPPGEESALELLADGKLQRLNLLFQNYGRIDGNRGGELDITGEKVAVAR